MDIRPETWFAFFESRGIQKALIDCYMRYVERMLTARLPPIFEIYHLAQLLGRTNSYVASAVNCPDHHYRKFTIPKRHGGKREYSALPGAPRMSTMDKWLYPLACPNSLGRVSAFEGGDPSRVTPPNIWENETC